MNVILPLFRPQFFTSWGHTGRYETGYLLMHGLPLPSRPQAPVCIDQIIALIFHQYRILIQKSDPVKENG
jgi:hypothetical protein